MINADPLDPTYQAKIAQEIRQKNIEENMEAALEFTPESFSHVVMLYLEIKVNTNVKPPSLPPPLPLTFLGEFQRLSLVIPYPSPSPLGLASPH